MKKNRRWLALGLAGVILAATGCGAATNAAGPTLSASAAQSATATTATASEAPKEPDYGFTPGGDLATRLIPGDVMQTSKGEYLRIAIDPADPVFNYRPELASPEILGQFSPDDITEFQKYIVDFAVTELIDSPLVGGAETPEQWWVRNAANFPPSWADQARATLGTIEDDGTSGSIVLEKPQLKTNSGQPFEYEYASSAPRIKAMSLELTEYFLDKQGHLAVTLSFKTFSHLIAGEAKAQMTESGTLKYSAYKTETGTWQLNGWNKNTDYNTAARQELSATAKP